MIKTDVLVIGSSAAGLVAATTGKRMNPGKKFTVVSSMPVTLIPCGIPYIFGTVGKSDNDILPVEKMFSAIGIETIYDDAVAIDREKKSVELKTGEVVSYEKLVIATGSIPYRPNWLEGAELEHVFLVPKNKVYLDEMQEKLEQLRWLSHGFTIHVVETSYEPIGIDTMGDLEAARDRLRRAVHLH